MPLKIKFSKNNLILSILCVYFTTKMLWDTLLPTMPEILSLLLVMLGVFHYFSLGRIKNYNFSIVLFVLLYILFSIYVLLNAVIQDTSEQFFRAVYEYVFYTAMLFSLAYYVSKVNFESIAKTVSFVGLIISLLSWYEYLTESYIIGHFGESYTAGFRAAVFTRSYLSHGMVLGFFSTINYYLYIIYRKKSYIILSAFAYISILTTSSRGPLVACFCALTAMYILNYRRRNLSLDKRAYLYFMLLCVCLAVIIFLNSTFTTGNSDIDYFLYRIRKIIDWTGDAGNIGRIRIWRNTVEMIQSSPFFGIGPSKTGSWGAGAIGVTESGILKHLCELGLIGFTIYYLLMFLVIKKGVSAYKYCSDRKKMEFIFYTGLVVMVLVNNTILQSTEEIMVAFIYWLGMGGLLSLYQMTKE